jgi:hypothetical protein
LDDATNQRRYGFAASAVGPVLPSSAATLKCIRAYGEAEKLSLDTRKTLSQLLNASPVKKTDQIPRGPFGPLSSSPNGSPDCHIADQHVVDREDFSAVGISILTHHQLQLDTALADLRSGIERASEWGIFWGMIKQRKPLSVYLYDVFCICSIPVEGTFRESGGVRRNPKPQCIQMIGLSFPLTAKADKRAV